MILSKNVVPMKAVTLSFSARPLSLQTWTVLSWREMRLTIDFPDLSTFRRNREYFLELRTINILLGAEKGARSSLQDAFHSNCRHVRKKGMPRTLKWDIVAGSQSSSIFWGM